MQIINLFGQTIVSMAVVLMFGGIASADAPRGSRSMMPTTNVTRMPTMPTVGVTTIGNPAVTTISTPPQVIAAQQYVPVPPPAPEPDPEPDEPAPDEPTPVQECADGGVKDSAYTVDMCMRDLKQCINTGALQGGLNDLFNEDVRNAIFGGMKLCQANIDKCIAEVRVNCRNIYNEKNDVWLDFNSRVIQPEYYNFVLRKTGLSPNQAENTCLLLDRNTYGAAFSSVSELDDVKAEYQRNVGAYNAAKGKSLTKDNPLGSEVNRFGYDGKRGHYARWDASNAECLLRVGAYNKNSAIKNSWLFGAVGNDNVAEVWKPAGSTFTCNKDLFGFSLLNDTKTAAVVGIAGGAVVGAGVGAGIGAGVYNAKKKDADAAAAAAENASSTSCQNETYRQKLGQQIKQSRNAGRVNTYLYDSVEIDEKDKTKIKESTAKRLFSNSNYENMTVEQCEAIHDLYSKARVYEDAIAKCKSNPKSMTIHNQVLAAMKGNKAFEHIVIENANGDTVLMSGAVNCGKLDKLTAVDINTFNQQCLFIPLQIGFAVKSPGTPFCDHDGKCLNVDQISTELANMKSLLQEIEPAVDKNVLKDSKGAKTLSKGAMIGKGAAIGAATGVGVGGLATAITAFVERSNITCKVGDGLNSVALGKSHTIDTLRDFYVKWNLQLPDTVAPTSVVTDVESWDRACSQYNSKLFDCPYVQISFKTDGKHEIISSACNIAGNLCIRNYAVSASHGID